jgi:hypothetical protein
MELKNGIRTRVRRSGLIGFSVIAFLTLAVSGKASLVQNGDFSATSLSSPGGYFGSGSSCVSNVTDWVTEPSFYNGNSCGSGGTPLSLLFNGTNGTAFNAGNGLYGMMDLAGYTGNYAADDGDPNFSAPFAQQINGLTVGATYTLTFYQAAAQQESSSPFGTSDNWDVSLSSTLFGFPTSGPYAFQTSDTMTVLSTSSTHYTPWTLQTMTFTAPSVTDYLNFFAVGSGVPPVALLADVSLTQTVAPEPGYLPILGVGLLGLFAVSRWRKRSAANSFRV